MARVELSGVSKIYPGGLVALDSLDLEVEEGELVVLVGPSGSGKSTLLRLIAGLERPTHGEIRMAGSVVTQLSPRERNVAFVLQSCPLYPHLNVYGNIAFSWRMRHSAAFLTRCWRRFAWSRAASSEDVPTAGAATAEAVRVQAAAEMLGIGHLLERWPQQLSGGERQRVALARAIVREPAAFLFDEPLSSLDAGLRSQLRRELKSLHKRVERAALYVTHDQAEALTLADRLVVLDRGRVQQMGAPSELYDRPRSRFVASFLGSPPMNFLSGAVQRSTRGWGFVSGNWQLELNLEAVEKLAANGNSASERQIELGIRPEAVELSSTSGRSGENFAEISLVETLGDVNLVYLQAGSGRLIAKVSAREPYRVGQRVAWFASWSQMHWFESLSGQRIDV